jgi:hypothetical protein
MASIVDIIVGNNDNRITVRRRNLRKNVYCLNQLINNHHQFYVIQVEKSLNKQNLVLHQCVSLYLIYIKKRKISFLAKNESSNDDIIEKE